MPDAFLSQVLLLLFVVDPFGNVPAVNAMLARVTPARRRLVVLRECAIAYLLLLAFMAFGRQMLSLMHLTQSSLAIAGGVILFMIAIRMVFPQPGGIFGLQQEGEPLIVPLATPLIAGPSAMAAVMLLASDEPRSVMLLAGALTATMAIATTILLAGEKVQHALGEPAMQAIERLMGLVLTALAVEMLLGGIRAFVEGLR
jgi:MarC family membrane protein